MPDLTFSEIPIERNVLGKTISSETWLDGQVVSKAEVTRRHKSSKQAPSWARCPERCCVR